MTTKAAAVRVSAEHHSHQIYRQRGMKEKDDGHDTNQGDCSSAVRSICTGAGLTDAHGGDRPRALTVLERLRSGKERSSPAELAILLTALGEREQAFASLEDAYRARDIQLQYLGASQGSIRCAGPPLSGSPATGRTHQMTQGRLHVTSARLRRILPLVLGTLVLFCVTPYRAVAQDRNNAVSTPRDNGLVKLPIVEQRDIRYWRTGRGIFGWAQ